MNVTEFSLESFRGGNPLRFVDLGEGLNVALAGSAEGAAELLQIIPGTLFGGGRYFSEDAQDVLIPVERSTLVMRGALGVFRLARDWRDPQPLPDLQAVDGRRLETTFLEDVLDGMSWEEYRDVFTFDLQRLARLLRNPRRMRQTLLRMARAIPAAPHERVRATPIQAVPINLAPVRELAENLAQLAAENPAQRNASDQPTQQPPGEDLARQLDAIQSALQETKEGLSVVDEDLFREATAFTASSVRQICSSIEAELRTPAKIVHTAPVDTSSQSALDRVRERIAVTQEELLQLRGELREITAQIRELNKDNAIVRWIPHVESLMAHEKGLLREEDAIEQLQEKIEDFKARIDQQKLDSPVRESRTTWAAELQLISRLEGLNDRIREAEAEQTRLEQRVAVPPPAPLAAPLPTSVTSAVDDPVALHQAEQRVAELRERISFSGKYEELLEQRSRLEERVRDLYERRLTPPAMVLFFGVPFVAGLALVIYALYANRSNPNWQQIGWGAVIVATTVIIKLLMDNQAAQDLDLARNDLRKVKDQLDRGEGLGAPGAYNALKAELRQAEQELRELRQRVPIVEASALPLSRPNEGVASDVLRGQLQDAKRRVRDLTQQFRDLLGDMDLSPALNLVQAREMLLTRMAQSAQPVTPSADLSLPFQLQALRAEWERRREWLATNRTQAKQIAQELGCQHAGDGIAELFDVLRDALRDHKERQQARLQLVKSYKRLRQRALRLRDQGRQLVKQRQKLVQEAQVQAAIRTMRQDQRIDRQGNLKKLLDKSVKSLEEMANALGVSVQDWHPTVSPPEAENRFASLRRRREELRDFLITQAEQVGRLRARLTSDRDNSASNEPQSLEWQAQARQIANRLQAFCDSAPKVIGSPASAKSLPAPTVIRHDPLPVIMETASRYLDQLSGGAYRRIARTHRGNLEIEDRIGDYVQLGDVARQHIGNIYFALWLARIDAYGEQGRRLPIVMHDPLAITPPKRRGAVTRLLQFFAARGHQILLITSHSQHAKIMASKGVPVANLANRERISTTDLAHHPGPVGAFEYRDDPALQQMAESDAGR